MARPLVLYSTGTERAYKIARDYYRDEHWLWCAPGFDLASLRQQGYENPRSSCPCDIYLDIQEDIRRPDFHSRIIQDNRLGILKGIGAKESEGIISSELAERLREAVGQAGPDRPYLFRPLVYIIPYSGVARMVEEVSPEQKAHPHSGEFIIRRCPSRYFQIITVERG